MYESHFGKRGGKGADWRASGKEAVRSPQKEGGSCARAQAGSIHFQQVRFKCKGEGGDFQNLGGGGGSQYAKVMFKRETSGFLKNFTGREVVYCVRLWLLASLSCPVIPPLNSFSHFPLLRLPRPPFSTPATTTICAKTVAIVQVEGKRGEGAEMKMEPWKKKGRELMDFLHLDSFSRNFPLVASSDRSWAAFS